MRNAFAICRVDVLHYARGMANRFPLASMASAVLLAAVPAFAQRSESDLSARGLAATCTACHTPGGARDAAIPPLAGARAAATAQAMREFKSGDRKGTLMPQLARGYTDAQIDAIAGWFAQQRR